MSSISDKFNISADVEREKQRQHYNLTPQERQEISAIRRQEAELDQQEVRAFKDPEIYNTRLQNEMNGT